MDNNNFAGKRISFYQLFADDNFVIEIPIIQRDYAQGRTSKKEVRELFLNALLTYLEEAIPNRDLDFVYGTTEVTDGLKKFIPLDGQQRLTTLFLLHWYLANISGKDSLDSFKATLLHNEKSRFSYLTRTSSVEFINALLKNDIDLREIEVRSKKDYNRASETIKDKGWYYASWSYDPTVKSMLNMIDAIHNKFYDKAYFYPRLIDISNPVITFLFLDLNEFKLTEDLYIKMNSRGKPLTAFENFKAKLEQHIKELYKDDKTLFSINHHGIERKVSCQEYFSFQIDTTWADLFWHYRDVVGKPYTFDEELMNFMRVIIVNQYALDNSSSIENLKELIKTESATSDITENLSFYRFQELGALTKEGIKSLIESFDVLVNGQQKIKHHFDNQFYFSESDIFKKALEYSLSLPERVLFHAYLQYLIIHKGDKTNFYQWMRVVHNLIENSRIEDTEQFINAIKSVESLFKESNNILEYLSTGKAEIAYYSSWQVEEESLKASLILKSHVWQTLIEDCEELSTHKGQILYIFEFSGILDYYKSNKNTNWNELDDEDYMSKFKFYTSRAVALFAIYEEKVNEKEHLLERALLTKGDYLFPASNSRFNFGSSKGAPNYQRDYSWKRLLRADNNWIAKRHTVKALLDDTSFNEHDVVTSLRRICQNVPNDWRQYIIQNPNLINYCQQGFIRIEGDDIELFRASQRNHYHCNMYIYSFYLTYIHNEKPDFEPFKNIHVEGVKSSEDDSYIILYDWVYKLKNYDISLYRIKDEFVLVFNKSKGTRNYTDYAEQIIQVLDSLGLIWDDENKCYTISRGSESEFISLLKDLCGKLKSLG